MAQNKRTYRIKKNWTTRIPKETKLENRQKVVKSGKIKKPNDKKRFWEPKA